MLAWGGCPASFNRRRTASIEEEEEEDEDEDEDEEQWCLDHIFSSPPPIASSIRWPISNHVPMCCSKTDGSMLPMADGGTRPGAAWIDAINCRDLDVAGIDGLAWR